LSPESCLKMWSLRITADRCLTCQRERGRSQRAGTQHAGGRHWRARRATTGVEEQVMSIHGFHGNLREPHRLLLLKLADNAGHPPAGVDRVIKAPRRKDLSLRQADPLCARKSGGNR